MAERTSDVPERIERDAMGEIAVPGWAYWGAQTERARRVGDISGLRIPPALAAALGLIKAAAARANQELGRLEPALAAAIAEAADEVAGGRWLDHFPVDVFQTGSGTSWNMNANEVVANRANELLGAARGARAPVHPNDHVNRGQSSNDVVPSAIQIANRQGAASLLDELASLRAALDARAAEFAGVVKLGRTHLQDAVPMTLGQEFSGYAAQIGQAAARFEALLPRLEELPLGGTAVGTGLGAHPEFGRRACALLAARTGLPLREAGNRFAAIAARDAQVEFMGAASGLAAALLKLAGDLRLLASGPRGGLGEIELPALQPGSSLMPGKINPVVPELVAQAAVQIMGRAVSVTFAGSQGPLELNIMLPLIAHETLGAGELLAGACRALRQRCLDGLRADAARCAAAAAASLALATPLAARIGYDRAAAIARRAWREGRSVRDIALAEGVLTATEADALLDPGRLARGEE